MNNNYVNEMEDYLYNHNYISRNKNKNPLRQQELSVERASCIVQKYRTLTEEKDKEIERLNKEKDDLDDCNRHLYNENKKLNNIINELEKYHIKSMKNLENTEEFKYIGINHIKILYEEHKRTLNKLKELKEGK